MNPQINFLINKALQSLVSSNLDTAELYLKQALRLAPKNPQALRLMGVVNAQKSNFEAAIDYFKKSLIQLPSNGVVHSNLGNVLSELKRYEEALEHHDKAIKLKPDYAEAWSNAGITFSMIGLYDKALICYEHAMNINPQFVEALYHKSNALIALKRFGEALANLDKAIEIEPDYDDAWSNKGIIYIELGLYDEAVKQFKNSIRLNPNIASNWSNYGIALNGLEQYQEAISYFQKAIEYDKDIDLIRGDLAHAKMHIANWFDLDQILSVLAQRIQANKMASSPFTVLSLFDSARIQQQCAQAYAAANSVQINPLGSILKHSKKEKIRIGYYSSDFRDHPVAHLLAEFFELHDKDKFEVYAFAFGAQSNSAITHRLKGAFSEFIEVGDQGDLNIAMLSRQIGIDIAVDLGGYTHGARPKIFAYRAAPIQVNYLGYPGTLGAEHIDYIIADRVVINEHNRIFFNEKVAYLPNSYLLDDSKRLASDIKFKRSDFGLPEDEIVFCCFNSGYKFNSAIAISWANILRRVEGSVLWLSESNSLFRINFVNEMTKLGIGASRIVFSERLDTMSDHLARCSLADLFLDTTPYNAHTTAVDFLKVGVPVITLLGEAFQSRVAASLLHAVGMPEMIAYTRNEYEDMAVGIAENPNKLSAIKDKLSKNRKTTALFDTPLSTKNIERAYQEMYRRYENGLKLEDFNLN